MYWHPLALGLLVLTVWVIGCGVGVVIGTQQDGDEQALQEVVRTTSCLGNIPFLMWEHGSRR